MNATDIITQAGNDIMQHWVAAPLKAEREFEVTDAGSFCEGITHMSKCLSLK